MSINKVAVVGIGTMGSQIGIVCARGGFQTTLVDRSEALISWGGSVIGFIWGFVQAFIAGVLIAWFYEFFSKILYKTK